MSLVAHTERELSLSGLLDVGSDYDGMIGECVLELVRVFADQGHSGESAMMTLAVFEKCARFENLTPLTSDSEDWNDVSNVMGKPLWQSKRSPYFFSEDGGETWTDIREEFKNE